ncbi:EndoU domain-containing protein, partial [Mageeibacillus indolicus]
DKYGIEYHIVKTYPNGVRVGYVPDHKKPVKQEGTNQAWFPAHWTTKDIKHAGEHVANLKGNKHVKDGVIVFGNWKGVRVGVIRTHGQIGTIFPDSNQPSNKRGRNNGCTKV